MGKSRPRLTIVSAKSNLIVHKSAHFDFLLFILQRGPFEAAVKAVNGSNVQYLTFVKDGPPQGGTVARMWTDRVQEVAVVFFVKGSPDSGGGNEDWNFEFSPKADWSGALEDLEDYVLKLHPVRTFTWPNKAVTAYSSLNNILERGSTGEPANRSQKPVECKLLSPWAMGVDRHMSFAGAECLPSL